MSTTCDSSIGFTADGLCSHCVRHDQLISSRVIKGSAGRQLLASLTEKIKAAGSGSDYYCIIGVSGSVDSTYVAYLVRQLGLRPLAVHFDNGWNSELAVSNIEKVLKRLNIDLYTYVMDWEELRDLRLSFLKASTLDGDIPSDHGIFALLWKQAVIRSIKYIISGMNFATEAVSVPEWPYGHSDWRCIRAVDRRFGSISL